MTSAVIRSIISGEIRSSNAQPHEFISYIREYAGAHPSYCVRVAASDVIGAYEDEVRPTRVVCRGFWTAYLHRHRGVGAGTTRQHADEDRRVVCLSTSRPGGCGLSIQRPERQVLDARVNHGSKGGAAALLPLG